MCNVNNFLKVCRPFYICVRLADATVLPFMGNLLNFLNYPPIFVVFIQGVVPATIGIIGGKIIVGLSNSQISMLSDVKTTKSIKTAKRDLIYVTSQRLNGGTTVSATIAIANKVGIPIFVTGGNY